MSLVWLFPAGLAALAALLLPLLIHLARRDEQRLIDFAALRWLAARPRPRRRIRFDEWPLLLVRLLLLALLAVLLARPALEGVEDDTPRIAVAPGVDLAAVRAIVDADKSRWLWLAPGFPALDAPAAPLPPQPLASLLRELDAALPPKAPLTVVVPTALDGLDAQRPQLSRTVRWQVIETASPAATATLPAAPRLHIRHDETGAAALPWLRAVGQAWNTPVDIADDNHAFADDGDVRVWLSAKPVPDALQGWARDGGRLLVDARAPLPDTAQRLPLWRDDGGAPVIEQVDGAHAHWLRWAAPLQPATMPVLLDAGFPQRLRGLLQAPPAPTRALATAMQPDAGAAAWPQPAYEPVPWLAAAIALLFLLERWLASARRRRGQP
ncbi:BatA domain-containing protein [Stenotrophomonas sp. PS02297]|uniref:BatA domain-containing protein n=1 Tax=Stenotrophomonas sp. PS02297 TaxID=2991423 RepID=UPI002499F2DE|nr:BatA domain-containing protein [Stenotrophomonas sp. PS02297]